MFFSSATARGSKKFQSYRSSIMDSRKVAKILDINSFVRFFMSYNSATDNFFLFKKKKSTALNFILLFTSMTHENKKENCKQHVIHVGVSPQRKVFVLPKPSEHPVVWWSCLSGAAPISPIILFLLLLTWTYTGREMEKENPQNV